MTTKHMTTNSDLPRVGDHVRRGKGKTIWEVISVDDNFISLRSTTQAWTKSSVVTGKASTLTPVDRAPVH